MEFIIEILSILSALLIALGITTWVSSTLESSQRSSRLQQAAGVLQGEIPLRGILERIAEQINQSTWGRKLIQRLTQADLLWTPARCVAIFGGINLLFYVAFSIFFSPPLWISILLSGSLAGLVLWYFLDTRRDHYIKQLANQMPDVAVLASNSMKAGLSIAQALAVIGEKMPPPAGTEFTWLTRQLQLGVPFDEAIGQMMERLPCEELHLFLTTIGIQRRAGGNLSRALATMSIAIMARHRVRGEISTLTAEARYTSLIVLFLPVFMLAMINQSMDGAVTAFLNDPVGWILTPIFVIVQTVSFVLIGRIAQIKV